MRNTKLALTVGLLALAFYGCGDSSGSGSKKDSGADAPSVVTKNDAGTATNTTTNTGTGTNTLTQTGTQTSTTTATGTRVDGSAGVDVASPPPVDGGAGDAPLVVPVDSGTPLDGTQAFDVGARVDSGSVIDGSARADGSASADVPVKNDSGTAAGKCDYPKCLLDLAKDCAPEGACVQQTTLPTGGTMGPWTTTTAACYANGVKMLIASTYGIDLTTLELTGTTTSTWKKASGICYSMETAYSAITPSSITYVIKNASGATVGTMTADTTANTQTITCTGEAPVVLPLNCESSGVDAGAGTACTTGACTF